jgi:hypothetical protein
MHIQEIERATSAGWIPSLELLWTRLYRENLASFFERKLVIAIGWAGARFHLNAVE